MDIQTIVDNINQLVAEAVAPCEAIIAAKDAEIASLHAIIDSLMIEIFPVDIDVPEGTDNGAILYTIESELNAPLSYVVTGNGVAMDGIDLIITDKIAFFADPVCSVFVQGVDDAERYDFTFDIVPGYLDVDLLGMNEGLWYDATDNRKIEVEAYGGYIKVFKDNSPFQRHMHFTIPDLLDRRPKYNGAYRVDASWGSSRFGLVCPEVPIWHGIRMARLFADRIELTAAETPNNNDKTVFTGLTSLVTNSIKNKDAIIVVYGDETECKMRVNKTEVGSLTAPAYFPPLNSFCFIYVANIQNTFSGSPSDLPTLFSPVNLGQHAFWEGGAMRGNLYEFGQLFDVEIE